MDAPNINPIYPMNCREQWCVSLPPAYSVVVSLSQVYRFAILNNVCVCVCVCVWVCVCVCVCECVCVLYVGVCVGVPQAFVRILGGCVQLLIWCYLVQASAGNRPQHVVCGSKYTADDLVKGRFLCANFSFRAFSLSDLSVVLFE